MASTNTNGQHISLNQSYTTVKIHLISFRSYKVKGDGSRNRWWASPVQMLDADQIMQLNSDNLYLSSQHVDHVLPAHLPRPAADHPSLPLHVPHARRHDLQRLARRRRLCRLRTWLFGIWQITTASLWRSRRSVSLIDSRWLNSRRRQFTLHVNVNVEMLALWLGIYMYNHILTNCTSTNQTKSKVKLKISMQFYCLSRNNERNWKYYT